MKSISVIVPAYNESQNLESTCREILHAIAGQFSTYEIIIINDGSRDGTDQVAERLASLNRSIRVLHNSPNMGFGYSYQRGVKEALMDYVAIVPGDNEIIAESIADIFSLVGSADVIIPFSVNMEVRPYKRRLASRAFTLVMNTIFNCNLQYYNGPVVHRREIIQNIDIKTSGFAFQATILTRLIRTGHSFAELGIYLRPRMAGRSSALKIKNIISVFKALAGLAWEIYIAEKGKYSYRKPNRELVFLQQPKPAREIHQTPARMDI